MSSPFTPEQRAREIAIIRAAQRDAAIRRAKARADLDAEILRLRDERGLSNTDIAAVLGIGLHRVSTAFARHYGEQ